MARQIKIDKGVKKTIEEIKAMSFSGVYGYSPGEHHDLTPSQYSWLAKANFRQEYTTESKPTEVKSEVDAFVDTWLEKNQ